MLSNLQESRNEWCSRLVSIFCPLVTEGIKSIFNESWKICVETDEMAKYLMTFQNFLSRIPKWNSVIVEEERKRIVERSGCNYLEDLITCVHIIQLKVLTCIRVGNKQKKIDITIPKLDHFIHKVYIHVARKVYTNVYLFEKNISPLQMQKNARELELIVQECIMTTIRESIPTEEIIRAYMDESVETEEEVTIEPLAEPVVVSGGGREGDMDAEGKTSAADSESDPIPSIEEDKPILQPKVSDLDQEPVNMVTFHEIDSILDAKDKGQGKDQTHVVKTIDRLEDTVTSDALQRKWEEEAPLDETLRIHTDSMSLGDLGIVNLNGEDEGTAGGGADSLLSLSMLDIQEI